MARKDPSLLRTQESYDSRDLKELKADGIKFECILNRIEGYHIFKNQALDLMHDLFSNGVAHQLMLKMLDHFIYKKNTSVLNT